MALRCSHPCIQKLQSPPLRDEASDYEQGDEDISCFPMLVTFAGAIMFAFASERMVEGGHATVNLRTTIARNRTEAYDSLTLRLHKVSDKIIDDPDFFSTLADLLSEARNPKKAITQLYLQNHPSCRLANTAWDRIYRKIVYRSDPHSLHNSQRPPVQVTNPDDDDDLPPPPPAAVVADADTAVGADAGPAVAADPGDDAGPAVGADDPSDLRDSITHQAAVDFFLERLYESHAQGDRCVYACKLPESHFGILASLTNMLQKSSDGGVVHVQPHTTHIVDDYGKWLFFSVICPRPSLSKRARRDSLRPSDVGIMVHRFLRHDYVAKTVVLSSTPANSNFDSEFSDAAKGAIVLRLSMIPLSSLKSCIRWIAQDDLSLSLREQLSEDSEHVKSIIPDVLMGLVERPGS